MATSQLTVTSPRCNPLVCPKIGPTPDSTVKIGSLSLPSRQLKSKAVKRSLNKRFAVSAVAHPAAGGRKWSMESQDTAVDLCIFPMWSLPLPTSTGSLNVFEPHLVALLQVVQQVAAASLDNTPARFGVLPYDWVQHQMWLEDSAVPPSMAHLGDTSRPKAGDVSPADRKVMGVSCDIEGVMEEPGGSCSLVKYCATQRFTPVQILRRKPFLVVRGLWVEDERGNRSSSHEGRGTDQLEQDLWQEMQEVVRCTSRLQGHAELRTCGVPEVALPETVCKLSPIASPRPTTAEERLKSRAGSAQSRMPAEVAVWRNMRPATAMATKGAQVGTGGTMADPYLAAGEMISKAARQEAFSFAAASVVELGPVQRRELLNMTSTAQRLHWLLQAIQPHLAALRTEVSMRQAMGDL